MWSWYKQCSSDGPKVKTQVFFQSRQFPQLQGVEDVCKHYSSSICAKIVKVGLAAWWPFLCKKRWQHLGAPSERAAEKRVRDTRAKNVSFLEAVFTSCWRLPGYTFITAGIILHATRKPFYYSISLPDPSRQVFASQINPFQPWPTRLYHYLIWEDLLIYCFRAFNSHCRCLIRKCNCWRTVMYCFRAFNYIAGALLRMRLLEYSPTTHLIPK